MDWTVVGVVIMVACVGSLVFTEVKKSMIFSRYRSLFERQDFAGCVELLDRPLSKLLFPRYNQLYMRLNALTCLDDEEGCRAAIEEMLGLRMNDEQRLVLQLRAFDFFVERGEYDRARQLLDELREKAPAEALEEREQTLDILANGSYRYIRSMESQLEGADAAKTVRLCYLLSTQYESKGDAQKAQSYLSRAREVVERGSAPAGREGAPSGDAGPASDDAGE